MKNLARKIETLLESEIGFNSADFPEFEDFRFILPNYLFTFSELEGIDLRIATKIKEEMLLFTTPDEAEIEVNFFLDDNKVSLYFNAYRRLNNHEFVFCGMYDGVLDIQEHHAEEFTRAVVEKILERNKKSNLALGYYEDPSIE